MRSPFRAVDRGDLRDALALVAAIAVVGASFGALAAAGAVPPLMIVAMSVLVFAGGAQFLVPELEEPVLVVADLDERDLREPGVGPPGYRVHVGLGVRAGRDRLGGRSVVLGVGAVRWWRGARLGRAGVRAVRWGRAFGGAGAQGSEAPGKCGGSAELGSQGDPLVLEALGTSDVVIGARRAQVLVELTEATAIDGTSGGVK